MSIWQALGTVLLLANLITGVILRLAVFKIDGSERPAFFVVLWVLCSVTVLSGAAGITLIIGG